MDPLGRVLCAAERPESVVGGDVAVRVADDARAVGDHLTQRRPELYD